MSSMDSGNPYVPPKPLDDVVLNADVVLAGVPNELQFGRSIAFVFENPNWLVNLLVVVACTLAGGVIPILPGMVLLGYQFEMIEALLARPNQTYPDFKFDRIMQYLMRGLYPLLVAIVAGLIAVPALLIVLGIPVVISAAAIANVGDRAQAILLVILIPIGVVYVFAIIFLLNLVMVPMIIRAGLAQDFGSAFNFEFIKDFASRMWKDMLYAGAFLVFAALAAELIGLVIFCVGILFTMAVVQLAQTHLGMQIYRLYLLRGGDKVLPKPTDAIVYP